MAEKLLNDEIIGQIKEIFAHLDQNVSMLFFGEESCDYCDDTLQLLEEVEVLSEKLSLATYDLDKDAEIAEKYRVDKAPGIVMVGNDGENLTDYGVRYAGIPSGHEFSSLINDLIRVSQRDSGLSEQTRAQLKNIKAPVHLMVFVTPTCPYCPQAVLLAHQLAMESPLIEAEMVEATEFPELSNRYNVSGVPQTTINYGAGTVVGAVPEGHLLAEILRSAVPA
ncbi:MAG: protein disulfide oxidoreductase [Anaerolineales bacterium]